MDDHFFSIDLDRPFLLIYVTQSSLPLYWSSPITERPPLSIIGALLVQTDCVGDIITAEMMYLA